MTILTAREKICPFMSAPIYESTNQEGVAGIASPFMTYCTADICMAWEPTTTISDQLLHGTQPEGYCKLTEEIR